MSCGRPYKKVAENRNMELMISTLRCDITRTIKYRGKMSYATGNSCSSLDGTHTVIRSGLQKQAKAAYNAVQHNAETSHADRSGGYRGNGRKTSIRSYRGRQTLTPQRPESCRI
jgi:hypothetical protein